MRTFVLLRERDHSGVSGVGRVAEGVQFTDGTVAIRWLTNKASTVIWSSLEDAIAVHGHHGDTQVLWVPSDEPKTQEEKIAFRKDWDRRVDEGRKQ